MPPKDNMLEDNFIDDDEDDFSFRDDIDVADKEVEHETGKPAKEESGKQESPEISVEIVDDTPGPDKGKRVADPDKDGPVDTVDEEELRTYSKDVRKRIKQLTGRQHAERRRADELSRQYEELQKFTKNLLHNSNNMAEIIDNGEKILASEHKQRWEANLAAAKQQYREAHEAGDPNGMAAAQENIARAAAAIDRVSMHQAQPMPRHQVEEFEKKFAPPPQTQRLDDKTQDWVDRNPWFNNDPLMHAYAMGVHNEVTRRGITPTDERYFKTIDKEMRNRFPEKFSDARPRRTQSVVAPASRNDSGRIVQKVTLTESQVRLARKLNLTPEQYAAELVKVQGR